MNESNKHINKKECKSVVELLHFTKLAAAVFLFFMLFGMSACKDKHRIVVPKEGPAHLIVQPLELKIGIVPQGSGVIEKEIAMINDGSEDLIITSVENLCECTKTEYVDKPIVPGHGRTLKISLDTNHLTPGEFCRTVVNIVTVAMSRLT